MPQPNQATGPLPAIMNNPPTVQDFVTAGRDVQNRSNRPIAAHRTEDRLFREFFGTSAVIALITWNLLSTHQMLPEGSKIKHLLWSLFWMKQYPTEGVATATVGGSRGKIDPKTFRKWVKPFVLAIADLHVRIVSVFF